MESTLHEPILRFYSLSQCWIHSCMKEGCMLATNGNKIGTTLCYSFIIIDSEAYPVISLLTLMSWEDLMLGQLCESLMVGCRYIENTLSSKSVLCVQLIWTWHILVVKCNKINNYIHIMYFWVMGITSAKYIFVA